MMKGVYPDVQSAVKQKTREVRRYDTRHWRVLAEDAEEKAKEARNRVAELELAAATFRRHEKEGTPWPLKDSATTQN
jgi:TRAP-type C4-dicarboxylate transport system substrate-binding protein